MHKIIVVACGILLPLSAQAQSESFIVKVGADTVAVERFTLSPTHLEGELVTRGAAARWKYSGDVAGDRIPVFYTAAYTGSDTAAAQSARSSFENDTVVIEVTTSGNTTTQRIATQRGALPLINLAFSFVEVATRSMRGDSASIAFFMITSGQTVNAMLRRVGTGFTGAGPGKRGPDTEDGSDGQNRTRCSPRTKRHDRASRESGSAWWHEAGLYGALGRELLRRGRHDHNPYGS
jgi:hypothetical protein